MRVKSKRLEMGKESAQALPAAFADINIALYVSFRIKPMSNAKRVSMIGSVIFLVIALTPAARTVAYAADTFYNGGGGATGVRELPLFVAKDFKIFEKYGLDVELISTDREKTPDRFAIHASAHGSVNLSIDAKLNSRSKPSPNS